MIKVWINGCFDILHRGHIELFKYGKSLGDELMVGLDDDGMIKRFKGNKRPYNTLQDRIEVIRSIKYVDLVCSFYSTPTLYKSIKDYNPNIMVVGSDWKGKVIIGKEIPEEIKYFDRVGDYSTTKILDFQTEVLLVR